MEVISSKSFEEDSSDVDNKNINNNSDINNIENINNNNNNNKENNDNNTISNNLLEEEEEEDFENNLNEMQINDINEIDELDEEEEFEEKIMNNSNNNNYEENEISNSIQNVENNTINTIDEENEEINENSINNNNNSNNGNEKNELNLNYNIMPLMNINKNINKQIPFVIFENDKFIITEEAKKLLNQIGNNKISIINIFSNNNNNDDKYYLINNLIPNSHIELYDNNLANDENNKNSLIIYSKPFIIKDNLNNSEFPCFIVDIINFEINDLKEENNESKIFLIIILISSLFLFISKDFNEESFTNFNYILKLIKTLKLKDISEPENNFELNQFMPYLIWILQNSEIKLEDKNGNTITEKQYMDNALKIVNSTYDIIEENNRIKNDIKNYFKERECYIFNNGNNFNNFLNNDKMINLKNKIKKKTKPKNFYENTLTGNMVLTLVESILLSINSGSSSIIYNLYKYLIKKEFLKYANNLIFRFSSELKEYRNDNINKKIFFENNQIEKYEINIFEKYVKEYLENNTINEEIKYEYLEKIKNKLNFELKKYQKENEKYFEEKFIQDLNLLSNKFMENFTSSDIYEKNSYKFFQDFENFRETAGQGTPDFNKKNEILFDKILLIIKKFINGKIMKIKVINDEKNYFEEENKKQSNKINELNKNLNNLKEQNFELNMKLNNDIKLEKKKNKRIEEKMNRLINNKTKEIENIKKELELETTNYENKIKDFSENNKNLEKEIKLKDDQLTVMKMNNDKVISLYNQKSKFLEREISNWKDKYNSVIKESMNKQNELNKENWKLKEQNKLLLKNIENQENSKEDKSTKNKNYKNSSGINGLITYIKMNFKDKKNKMIKLDKYFLNKKKQSSNLNQIKEKQIQENKIQEKEKEDQIINKKKYSISNISVNSNTTTINSNTINNNAYSEHKYSSKTENIRHNNIINNINNGNTSNTYETNKNPSNNNIPMNNNINIMYNPSKLNIKIIKGRIKKDKNGKPYLEYIININYDSKISWNINRRFNQFTNLYRTLRNISKENFELPESSNIFSNITQMFSGLSHENKILQLEKYLKDLIEMPEINNLKQLYFFLELNHLYENNKTNNKINNRPQYYSAELSGNLSSENNSNFNTNYNTNRFRINRNSNNINE